MSWIAPGRAVPALFTSTWIVPACARTKSQNASIDSESVTSNECTIGLPPISATSFAVSSSCATRRAPSATVQPSSPRAIAIARPIPADAPVTTATRDAFSPGSGAKEFAAVDVQRLTGDDLRPRRYEEHHAVGDVVLRRDE